MSNVAAIGLGIMGFQPAVLVHPGCRPVTHVSDPNGGAYYL